MEKKKKKDFAFKLELLHILVPPVYATCFEIAYIKDTCLILLNTAFSFFCCCYLWDTNTCEIQFLFQILIS